MSCRRNSPGNPCCGPCSGTCTGGSANVSNMRFEVSGTFSHDVSKAIRDLRDDALFNAYCLKDSCASPTINVGAAGPNSLPTRLRDSDCCAAFGWVTNTTEGASGVSHTERDWQFTITQTESGTTPDFCNGGTNPWEINTYYLLKGYVSIIAKRIVDSVKITLCPIDGPYGTLLWSVAADVCYRVVYKTKENGNSQVDLNIWRQFSLYNIFTDECVDATVKKYCGNSCRYGGAVQEVLLPGFADLSHDCTTSTSYTCYDATPLTTLTDTCPTNATTYSCSFHALATTRVVSVVQRRVITIDRTCTLPATLTFTSADIAYDNDITVGWQRYLIPNCDYEYGTKIETGDHSDFTVYLPMTQTWTISLS